MKVDAEVRYGVVLECVTQSGTIFVDMGTHATRELAESAARFTQLSQSPDFARRYMITEVLAVPLTGWLPFVGTGPLIRPENQEQA